MQNPPLLFAFRSVMCNESEPSGLVLKILVMSAELLVAQLSCCGIANEFSSSFSLAESVNSGVISTIFDLIRNEI